MRFPLASLVLLFAASSLLHAADPPPPLYSIRLVLSEESRAAKGTPAVRILAEPTVATTEKRQAEFWVGGETTINGEALLFGTKAKVRIESRGAGQAQLPGSLEVSAISNPNGDDGATRTATTIYLHRTLALGKTIRVALPEADQRRRWCEITVESLDQP